MAAIEKFTFFNFYHERQQPGKSDHMKILSAENFIDFKMADFCTKLYS